MKKDIPLTIESITDADEKECRISSPKQIQSILRDIAESGTNAALYYNAKRDFIMTTILDLDEDGLWVEPGHSATENHHIGESRKITLVSSHNHVKVQCAVNGASIVTYDDQPAFFLPMPTSLYRLQRREYFRLSLLPSEYLRCIIETGRPKVPGTQEEPPKPTIPVMDISGGGVGLIFMEDEFDFEKGAVYQNCRIDLPEIGPIEVNLIVRNIIPLSTNKFGKTMKRAGCEFKNIDGPTTLKLQRFITDKQRLMAANASALL
ncbi:MAG TPA: flagellar brake protein [Gallionella sp.]|nr:flagellar brake protein [Gallionella sp.]